MNKYISLILSAAVIFGSTESNANTDECKESLVKVTTELLYTEGFNQINTCSGAGTSDNCQLDFYGCYAPDTRSDLPPKKRTRVSCGFRQFLVVVRSHVFDRGVESA